MICPSCNRELPQDSKFCQYCGYSLSSTPSTLEITEVKTKKKPKLGVIITCIVLVLALVAAGTYWVTYSSAKNAAIEHDYNKAKQLILVPSLTEMHDPSLIAYINAGQQLTQGHYTEAKKSFKALDNYLDSKELEKEASYYEALDQLKAGKVSGYKTIASLAKGNFKLAVDGLEAAKKQAYDYAVSLYRKGETSSATLFFRELSGYKRSSDYLTLINKSSYTAVKKLIGFEDADDILLDSFADQFLLGSWKSNDGRYYFSITEDKNKVGSYHSNYNLPYTYLAHSYYDIADGIYYLYDQDTSILDMFLDNFERKNVFRFTIIDADTITVYCYKDGSTYKLFRQ